MPGRPPMKPREHYLGTCYSPNCNGSVVWVWGCFDSKTIVCKRCKDLVSIREDGRCFGDGNGNKSCNGDIKQTNGNNRYHRVACTSCRRTVAWFGDYNER